MHMNKRMSLLCQEHKPICSKLNQTERMCPWLRSCDIQSNVNPLHQFSNRCQQKKNTIYTHNTQRLRGSTIFINVFVFVNIYNMYLWRLKKKILSQICWFSVNVPLKLKRQSIKINIVIILDNDDTLIFLLHFFITWGLQW